METPVGPSGQPPTREFAPVDDSEFYWQFAYSENDSVSRHGDAWREGLGPRVSGILRRGARTELSEVDWQLIRKTLLRVRGWYIETLIKAAPRWGLSRLDTPELGAVRLIRHEPFRVIAPSLHLAEFVSALDAGKDTPGDRFAGRYNRLRYRFEPTEVRGVPILVAESLKGPFIEIDGLTRMSILYSRWARKEAVPDAIPVLLGLSERLGAWSHY